MEINFKTILCGLFGQQDADMIIITTVTMMLSKMREHWQHSSAENAERLHKESDKHHEVLWNCMVNGELPDEEYNAQEYLDVKNALVWVADNIGSFWV